MFKCVNCEYHADTFKAEVAGIQQGSFLFSACARPVVRKCSESARARPTPIQELRGAGYPDIGMFSPFVLRISHNKRL